MLGVMTMIKKFALLLAAAALFAGCTQQEDAAEEQNNSATEESAAEPADQVAAGPFPQLTEEVAEDEVLVRMQTSMGQIDIKLFPELAPKTVENFLGLAEEGYYDGIGFHRVIPGFMIQGGDPTGTGAGGESFFGEAFEDEFHESLFNLRGALSMANAGPNTNGSQFFIVQADSVQGDQLTDEYPAEVREAYEANGGTPWLDGGHTVFGQVIGGMDVVDAIAQVETQQDKPVEPVLIESVEIMEQ